MKVQFPEKLEPLFRPARYKILYGGRGGAKSWGVARALLILGMQRPLRILCAREVQKTIEDSVHKLLDDQIEDMGLRGHYSVLETVIQGANGTEFKFAGLRQQDANKIRSFEGVDICWVEEAHTVSKKSWNVLIPTIRRPGSEIWVTFNPDLDTDDTYVRFVKHPPPDSALIEINYRDNPWFPEVLEQERKHLQVVDPDEYECVWEGRPRSVVPGAIYAKEVVAAAKERRIRPVPYDPALPVHTIWDLGWNDSMAIGLVQRVYSEVRLIHYIEDSHRTLASYVSELRELRYVWGQDWLPHDGETADYKTGKSAKQILRGLGRNVRIVPKMTLESGIKAVRMMFPRLYVDEDRCSRLLECLRRYRRGIPTTTNEPAAPVHDEYSHGADMVRYLSIVVDRINNDDQPPLRGEAFQPSDPAMGY